MSTFLNPTCFPFQRYLVLQIALLFCVSFIWGQGITARIDGRVLDAGGGGIPGARITLNEVKNAAKYEVQSDSEGRYRLLSVPSGDYQLQAEAPGFKTLVKEGISLQVNQAVSLDLLLEVGQAADSITVQESIPNISTESTAVGSVIENKQIVNMPLNGRVNIAGLLNLTPGVQNAGNQNAIPTFGVNPDINGSPGASTSFTLDGVSNNLPNVERGTGNYPSLEAIQEFKVVSANGSAEFGKGGAEVVVVTKSGTNAFHGSLLWFNRNAVTSAENALVKPAKKPAFNRNEFGGSAGGPVLIPRVYNGKNRTFFFVSYEGLRIREPAAFTVNVPTDALRSGNFAGLTPLIDPLSGSPFPNNQIPSGRINPVTKKLQEFYPAPNLPGTGAAGTGNNFNRVLPNPQDVNRYSIRVDHEITQKDQFYARFLYSNLGPTPALGPLSTLLVSPDLTTLQNSGEKDRALAVVETHTFGPSAVNEFRGGYSYNPIFRTPQHTKLDSSSLIPGLPPPVFGGLPVVNIVGFLGMGETLSGSQDKADRKSVV